MADISSKSVEVLQQELSEKREALRSFRFGGAGSRSRNVREGRNLRKDIARIMTVLSEKLAKATKNA